MKLLVLPRAKGWSVFKPGLCPLGGDISQLPQLLLCVCETVKDEAVALTDSTRLLNQADSAAEDEDSMETDCPRSSQKDQRDGVSWRKQSGTRSTLAHYNQPTRKEPQISDDVTTTFPNLIQSCLMFALCVCRQGENDYIIDIYRLLSSWRRINCSCTTSSQIIT